MIIKDSKVKNKFLNDERLFIIMIAFSLFMCFLISQASAVQLTEYTELNTNNTVHIKTEQDLSQNYTILFDNTELEYKPTYDIIKTGLDAGTDYNILIISETGQIQQIQTKTQEADKKPFYMIYGIEGLFILSLILLVIGYMIPMFELIAIPIELIGFIQAIKSESALSVLIFVIMFAISCLIFAYYGNKTVLR